MDFLKPGVALFARLSVMASRRPEESFISFDTRPYDVAFMAGCVAVLMPWVLECLKEGNRRWLVLLRNGTVMMLHD